MGGAGAVPRLHAGGVRKVLKPSLSTTSTCSRVFLAKTNSEHLIPGNESKLT